MYFNGSKHSFCSRVCISLFVDYPPLSISFHSLSLPLFTQIISEVYLMSHLRGRKHQEMLANLQPSPSSSSSSSSAAETSPDITCIIEASEEHQGPPCEQPEVIDRIKAGKKRAKKLRHRMASRSKEREEGGGRTQQQAPATGTASSGSGSGNGGSGGSGGGGSSPATQTKHRAK
jgi:hypothetical protein